MLRFLNELVVLLGFTCNIILLCCCCSLSLIYKFNSNFIEVQGCYHFYCRKNNATDRKKSGILLHLYHVCQFSIDTIRTCVLLSPHCNWSNSFPHLHQVLHHLPIVLPTCSLFYIITSAAVPEFVYKYQLSHTL
jgi:hypothetical protein